MSRNSPLVGWLAPALGFVLEACASRAPMANAPATVRRVFEPTAIAVLSKEHASQGLPTEVWLGGALGRTALFLKFPSEWRASGVPVRAFIALSKSTRTAPDPAPVTLEAWRVGSAWEPADLRGWSDKPDLALPYGRVSVFAAPTETVRIDVSELVRFLSTHPERDFGIAVSAHGASEQGLGFSTGMSGGTAPRLELYLR